MTVPVVQIDVPLDGTIKTDASGNYSFTTQIHPANWSVVRLVGQVAGYPTWSLLSDSSLPLDFAVGALASLGLVLVAPGQRLTVQVLNAQPSSIVSAHFVGVMNPDLNAVLPFYMPSPNPIGSSTASPPIILGTLNVPINSTVTQDFSLSAGINIIGYSARNLQPSTSIPPQNIQITGKQSGMKYVNATLTGVLDPIDLVVRSPVDTAVTLSVTTDPAALVQSTVDLIAWTQPTLPPRLQPRPWEVPLQKATLGAQSIAAGGTVNLIPAGSFSQGIYLHGYSFMHDGSNAQGRFTLFEAFGPTVFHEMWGGAVRGVLDEGSFRGWRMPNAFVGVSLQNNSAAAEFVGGFLEYSYGP